MIVNIEYQELYDELLDIDKTNILKWLNKVMTKNKQNYTKITKVTKLDTKYTITFATEDEQERFDINYIK